MKQFNNLLNKPISGESFFEPVPRHSFPLDATFVPLDKSIIWHCNYLFWKHFTLWEKTYNEHYEASLPSGVSESHKDGFILTSVQKFIRLLINLEKTNNLPKDIFILEQGPGSGIYAKKFLDYLKEHHLEFYKHTQYILQDTSQEILEAALKTLRSHKNHVRDFIKLPKNLCSKILFARHSNLWDQLPAKIFILDENNISEIFVQAVIDQHIGNKDFCSLQKTHIEQFITTHTHLWEPLIRILKFKTKIKKLTQNEISRLPYLSTIEQCNNGATKQCEIIFSKGVLDNLRELISMIDWQRNGYIEIVDIIVPTIEGFQKNRRPKKYDGSIATVVNGLLIATFLQEKKKHTRFEQIRGINYTVTMRNHNLQTLLEAKDFITIGEIAARRDEPIAKLKENAESLLALGIDVVGFSDQAFVKPGYLSQKEIVDSNIFAKLPGTALMPILKTRNKTRDEIKTLADQLKKQKISNLFIVTGDPGLEKEVLHDSISITKILKNDFFIGGVANPHTKDIPKTFEKIKAGTRFFIIQATYD